jgi:phosphohistidine phosphatase SixA
MLFHNAPILAQIQQKSTYYYKAACTFFHKNKIKITFYTFFVYSPHGFAILYRSMKLYLVRHGAYALETSSDRGPALSSYGRSQAQAVGAYLRAQQAPLTHVLTSGYLRAQETANLIQAALETTIEPLELIDFSPSGDPFTMKAIIEALPAEGLLVVGHMSSIAQLARLFCAQAPNTFRTCTTVILNFQEGHWRLEDTFTPTET